MGGSVSVPEVPAEKIEELVNALDENQDVAAYYVNYTAAYEQLESTKKNDDAAKLHKGAVGAADKKGPKLKDVKKAANDIAKDLLYEDIKAQLDENSPENTPDMLKEKAANKAITAAAGKAVDNALKAKGDKIFKEKRGA
eukprot:TRINITY_DN13783_c0_g2_i2.p2 TRINITY_DN13783_c0_g2~~TRINITY_DN13783_c0_g2_i2.p2  ORF type:complete len:140 (-),score=54.99 TRINITY_DN13783_c0_g2_i2:99-518(-)